MKQKQILAIELMAMGMPVEEVAESLNISKVTIYRWLKDDAFKNELENKSKEIVNQLSRKLAGIVFDNIGEVENLLTSSNANIRVRAWGIVLSRLMDIIEISRLEERVSSLEEKAMGG